MIKKRLMLLVFLTLSLASCGTSNDTSNSDSEPVISSSSETRSDFDILNELLKKEYSHLKYEITTSKNDLSLESIYEIQKENDGYHISYSKEKYNTFDIDNGSLPSEMKTSETSSYIAQENEYSFSKFTFSSSTFKNYSFNENSFSASVDNGKDYLGTNYNCNNFSIAISFNNAISGIEINYTLDDGTNCHITFSDIR